MMIIIDDPLSPSRWMLSASCGGPAPYTRHKQKYKTAHKRKAEKKAHKIMRRSMK